MVPYPDADKAATLDPAESPWYRTLNGQWKFSWAPHPEARPIGFYETGFDDAGWGEIPVPSNMEIEGHGVPIYVNTTYPWGKGTPPTIPHELNSVGSYRHRFELPESWRGRRVMITFDGVSSAFYLWVNGTRVGYSQESRTPAEFDITDVVRRGRTFWRWRCTATRTAPTWSARTSGASPASTATWSSGPPSPLRLADFSVVTDLDEQYGDARSRWS